MRTYAYICIHMHTYAYMNRFIFRNIMYICMHTYTYICMHMHTYTYTCIHTWISIFLNIISEDGIGPFFNGVYWVLEKSSSYTYCDWSSWKTRDRVGLSSMQTIEKNCCDWQKADRWETPPSAPEQDCNIYIYMCSIVNYESITRGHASSY